MWLDLLAYSSVQRRWLKISGMYIFPVLWLNAGLVILIWMAALASGKLLSILVYSLEAGDVGSGVIVGSTVFVNCIGDMTVVFFYSYF